MGIWYCTREDVKSSSDFKETARNNVQVDRAIEAASRSIESFLHRKFYPTVATRYFPFPNSQYARPWRLWLDADELISVTTLTSAGVAISSNDYFLEPANSGPPFTYIELDLDSSAAFGGASTHQRSIAIAGVFGHSADEESAGALAEALDSSETGVDVTDSAVIGVGQIIKADSERMIVTGKTMLTTGQTLQTPLTASAANVLVAVTTGSAYNTGETILLDSERMLIEDIAGNNLIVKRAYDGSVLAAHSGSTIYAPRTLIVQRGALGTTAASHNTSTSIVKHVVPGLVHELAVAESVNAVVQESAGYARASGSGDNQQELIRIGLDDIRDRAYTAYGRKVRSRAV